MTGEGQEERDVISQIARDQKVVFHVFMPILSQPPGDLGVREQKANLESRSFDRMREHPCKLVDDLEGDSSDGAGDNRLLFLQRLGHRQPEAFLQGFLYDDG